LVRQKKISVAVVDVSSRKISSSSSSSRWLRGKVIGRGSFSTVNLAVNKFDDNYIFAVKSDLLRMEIICYLHVFVDKVVRNIP